MQIPKQLLRYVRHSLAAAVLLPCLAGASTAPSPGTLEHLRSTLAGRVTFKSLATDQGALLLAPELGGKVIGIALADGDGRNLLFTHARLADPGFLTAPTDFFNPGGDRCWLAPSARFNFDAQGALRIPAAIDPAKYRLVQSPATHAVMETRIQVEDDRGNAYDLTLRREIVLLDASPHAGVTQLAYRCTNRLRNRSPKSIGTDLPLIALKTFVEVRPPGEVLIALAPQAAANPAVNYLEPFPVQAGRGVLSVRLDGGADGRRQKIGLTAAAVTGRHAFVASLGAGTSMALVRVFPVEPDGTYVENRDDARGKAGDAIQIYDDNGRLGGFAEMEELGPARPIRPDEEIVHPVITHVLTGPDQEVRQMVRRLLQIDG